MKVACTTHLFACFLDQLNGNHKSRNRIALLGSAENNLAPQLPNIGHYHLTDWMQNLNVLVFGFFSQCVVGLVRTKCHDRCNHIINVLDPQTCEQLQFGLTSHCRLSIGSDCGSDLVPNILHCKIQVGLNSSMALLAHRLANIDDIDSCLFRDRHFDTVIKQRN